MATVPIRPHALITLAAMLLLLCARDAEASQREVEELITTAEDAFLDVEYEEALTALGSAESAGGATDAQLARIYALRGTIYYLQEDVGRARTAYLRLLAMDPNYELPDEHPPRAAEFLERIRAERAEPLAIVHRPPREFRGDEPMELVATVTGVTRGQTVRVFYRPAGARSYRSTEMERAEGNIYTCEIPLDPRDTEAVEYFILVAAGEERLANEGSPREPFVVPVEERAGSNGGTSIARRWWFWTIIGVAVAAGLGMGLGFGLGGASTPDTGNVEITLEFE